MAKAKTTKKKIKEPKVEKPVEPAPPIQEGLVSIAMAPQDLLALANLMSVCAQTFEKLASDAAAKNDEVSFTILSSRQKLSSMFSIKLVEFCGMPEPVSREMH